MSTDIAPIVQKILNERASRRIDNLPPLEAVRLGCDEWDELRATALYSQNYTHQGPYSIAGIPITKTDNPGIHFTP